MYSISSATGFQPCPTRCSRRRGSARGGAFYLRSTSPGGNSKSGWRTLFVGKGPQSQSERVATMLSDAQSLRDSADASRRRSCQVRMDPVESSPSRSNETEPLRTQ